ncbi:MAG: response regulator transcription factor [Solirubrobacterales bacterium]
MKRTVLIVDDHPGFRSSARRMLESGGFAVVGEAGDGEDGIAAVEDLAPELVLLDVQLPGIDGFEVSRTLAARERGPDVILTSTREISDFGGLVAESGARGFISKGDLTPNSLKELLG